MASKDISASKDTSAPEDTDDSQKWVGRCPMCRKPAVYKTRPFCSSRCRDVDLGKWFSGSYTSSRPLIDEDDIYSTDLDG